MEDKRLIDAVYWGYLLLPWILKLFGLPSEWSQVDLTIVAVSFCCLPYILTKCLEKLGICIDLWIPGIPTTIKTMGVNITSIAYLRVLIIEIGSTIILMVVEAQGECLPGSHSHPKPRPLIRTPEGSRQRWGSWRSFPRWPSRSFRSMTLRWSKDGNWDGKWRGHPWFKDLLVPQQREVEFDKSFFFCKRKSQ